MTQYIAAERSRRRGTAAQAKLRVGHANGEGEITANLFEVFAEKAATRRDCTFAEEEVHWPAGMVGLRVRVAEQPAWIGIVQAFGASPTAIAFGDLYSGINCWNHSLARIS